MKSKAFFVLLILFLTNHVQSQSLGPERIDKINRSIVHLFIDNKPAGTGFFVGEKGWIATCYHVFEKSLNTEVDGGWGSRKSIVAVFYGGETVEVHPMKFLKKEGLELAKKYDYMLLSAANMVWPEESVSLRIGNWNMVNEDDIVYTIGFPLTSDQRFISQGILSTKYESSGRQTALVDFTLNPGNSGGPVIKLGETSEDDAVIGIATFVHNPYASQSEITAEYFKSVEDTLSLEGRQNMALRYLFERLSSSSFGIGGVISINYLRQIQSQWTDQK